MNFIHTNKKIVKSYSPEIKVRRTATRERTGRWCLTQRLTSSRMEAMIAVATDSEAIKISRTWSANTNSTGRGKKYILQFIEKYKYINFRFQKNPKKIPFLNDIPLFCIKHVRTKLIENLKNLDFFFFLNNSNVPYN